MKYNKYLLSIFTLIIFMELLTCSVGQNNIDENLLLQTINKDEIEIEINKEIEVMKETESKEEVLEALEAKADIIMLDNMSPEVVKEMVQLINGQAIVETSGNIVLENIKDYAETGVDYISVGALTHSFKVLDISLKELTVVSC